MKSRRGRRKREDSKLDASGASSTSRLRRKGAPIVMLTAHSGELSRVIGFEAGANHYITKPFSPRDLERRVKSLLQRR